MVQVSRRQFMQVTGSSLAASSLAVLGFSPSTALAEVRQFKLTQAKVTRQTCTYCSVGCGLLMYAHGDSVRNVKETIMHVEGDPDHPVNRGTLCPKGAALKDTVHSQTRLTQPRIRRPGSDRFEEITWEEALDKIARALKDDRDANLIQQNEAGVTVNRWTTTGFLAASATTNETAWLTYKAVRSMGIVGFDNQARV